MQVIQRNSMLREVIAGNIARNAMRGLPGVPAYGACQGSISVCGNGPSLKGLYPKRYPIAALNGAGQALAKRGITPNYVIAYDPDPHNVAWFKDAPRGVTYFLGSRMDPAVFDLMQDHNVIIWHLADEPEREQKLGPPITGGGTVGTHAINLLAGMGYDNFDLYGYDCCYARDGSHHATDQDWAIEPPKLFQVGDRAFLASPWMIGQLEWMLLQIRTNQCDYTVKVHGDGLLAAALEYNTLNVLYDLDVAPGSFDFMHSLMNIQNYMDENSYHRLNVHFKPGSDQGFRPNELIYVSHAGKQRMMNKVVRPMLKFFAATEQPEPGEDARQFSYSPQESLYRYRRTGELPQYKPSKEARLWAHEYYPDSPVVITLREAEHWPVRNSDVYEWLKFAKYIQSPSQRVVFVRDTDMVGHKLEGFETCDEASLDLHKRLALYRKAKMNLSVMTGPAALSYYSRNIPYAVFFTSAPGYRCYSPEFLQRFIGIDPGGQFPWVDAKRQRLVYADDDFKIIKQVYNELTA